MMQILANWLAIAEGSATLLFASVFCLLVSGIFAVKSANGVLIRDRQSRLLGRWHRQPYGRLKAGGGIQDFLVRRIEYLARSIKDNDISSRKLQLARAGYRSRVALTTYKVTKFLCPSAGLMLAFLLSLAAFPNTFPLLAKLANMIALSICGFYLPDMVLKRFGTRRLRRIRKSLPDGLDLLVICAEAGLSLDASLVRVGEEFRLSARELADEINCVSVELGFLPDRKQAFGNFVARCDLAEIRSAANTLTQTEKYGTPLAQSLKVLASDFREQRMLRAEEKAARLPAIMTVPMILFILPALFVVLIGPAILDVYDHLVK